MDNLVLQNVMFCAIICMAKIVEISMSSLKTVLLVKGMRAQATILAFIECMIWGLVVSTIIGTLGDNYVLLVFYCFGYATGLFLGSTLESKIALGTSSLQLIANDENTERIVEYLKKNSRGYTVFDGWGSTDRMNMIFIVLPRRDISPVVKDIRRVSNNNVFVVVDDVNKYSGGYGMVK